MAKPIEKKLGFSRYLLLCSAGLAVIAISMLFGVGRTSVSQAQSKADHVTAGTPSYHVVSIRRTQSIEAAVRELVTFDQFSATNVTLQKLIQGAYGIQQDQVSGGPEWLTTEKYDIEAMVDKTTSEQLKKLNESQRLEVPGRMMRALLADQFKLRLHRESRNLSVYALIVAKNGVKFQATTMQQQTADSNGGAGRIFVGPSQFSGQGVPLALFAGFLGQQLGRTVLDRTGLAGNYDLALQWQANEDLAPAIQEQLGLELVAQEAPMEVLVLDHAERPNKE